MNIKAVFSLLAIKIMVLGIGLQCVLVHICVQFFGGYMGMELMEHRCAYMVALAHTDRFLKWLHWFVFLSGACEGSGCPVSLTLFKNCSSKCIVVSRCVFNMSFPDDWWCWEPFHVFMSHWHTLFVKFPFRTATWVEQVPVTPLLFHDCGGMLYMCWVEALLSHSLACLSLS